MLTDGLPIEPVMRGREVQPGLVATSGTLYSTTSVRLRGDLVDAFVTARFTDLQLENFSNATLGSRDGGAGAPRTLPLTFTGETATERWCHHR